jgi:hypothetical protein
VGITFTVGPFHFAREDSTVESNRFLKTLLTMHANGQSVRAIAAQIGVLKSLLANILNIRKCP